MGRKRKNNPLGLPPRCYFNHGRFWYEHPGTRKWEDLGTDLAAAKEKANHYNDPTGLYGTLSYWLDEFILHCERRVLRSELAPRTLADYRANVVILKAAFGHFIPSKLASHDIADFLDLGAELGRPIRANREKACLSAAYSWMMRKKETGVTHNPCIGVRRNKESPKEKYVETEDYIKVRAVACRQVRGLIDLIYRTLQRPEDIIRWTPANIVVREGRRVIRDKQDKTGAEVFISITPEIEDILTELQGKDALTGPGKTLIHTRKGKPYSYSGLCAMLRRAIKKAGAEQFSPYDMKAKGATDMWLDGVPLEQIQVLCRHKSVRTTEIYVKSHWRGTVEPNNTNLPDKTSETL